MIRNFNSLGPGPSQPSNTVTITTTPQGSHNVQQQPPPPQPSMSTFPAGEPPVNLASKVAEVFLTAGHAFQKLGDLTLQLHTNVEPDECKWTEKDVDQLRDSLTRFAHELDMISQSVQGRTTKHIKTDIKRRHLMPDDPRRPSSPSLKRPVGMVSAGGLTAKRVPVMAGTKALPMATRPVMGAPQRIAVSHSSIPPPPQLQQQMNTPLLSDPSHHYINTSQ